MGWYWLKDKQMICKTPKNDWDKLCGFGRTITYQSINHWAIKSSLVLEQTLKMEQTKFSDLSSQISQTLDITPKKMKTTNSKSFLYFGRFWYFPRKLKYLTENFHFNCYCSPWSHLTYISIVTSVLWNKESFFSSIFFKAFCSRCIQLFWKTPCQVLFID